MTQTPPTALEPIVKNITVPLAVDAAFRHFSENIATWWPRATQSVGKEKTVAVVLEGVLGGRLYERHADGAEHDWGVVTIWEPPSRLAFTWHPGRDAETAQTVEVRFHQVDAGAELALIHGGWDKLGADAVEIRRQYVGGWEHVLGLFADLRP